VVVVLRMRVHVGMGFVGHWNVVTVMMLICGSVVIVIMLLVQDVFLGAGFDDLVMIEQEFPVGSAPVVGYRTWRVF
jgi:hypothetical protein